MNKEQKIGLWIGSVLVAVLCSLSAVMFVINEHKHTHEEILAVDKAKRVLTRLAYTPDDELAETEAKRVIAKFEKKEPNTLDGAVALVEAEEVIVIVEAKRELAELEKNKTNTLDYLIAESEAIEAIVKLKQKGTYTLKAVHEAKRLLDKVEAGQSPGFWTGLSSLELVGLCTLAGLGGAGVGFCGTWLAYVIIKKITVTIVAILYWFAKILWWIVTIPSRTVKSIYNLQPKKKRKLCLWIGTSVFVLMGLFPPVKIGTSWQYIEYSFILNPSGPILLSNLIVQWIVVTAITGGLIYHFRDKKPKDDQKQ